MVTNHSSHDALVHEADVRRLVSVHLLATSQHPRPCLPYSESMKPFCTSRHDCFARDIEPQIRRDGLITSIANGLSRLHHGLEPSIRPFFSPSTWPTTAFNRAVDQLGRITSTTRADACQRMSSMSDIYILFASTTSIRHVRNACTASICFIDWSLRILFRSNGLWDVVVWKLELHQRRRSETCTQDRSVSPDMIAEVA
nr:hypothetical protein CFP56_22326 [Quercus suber]